MVIHILKENTDTGFKVFCGKSSVAYTDKPENYATDDLCKACLKAQNIFLKKQQKA